jgi:hypothetical protein
MFQFPLEILINFQVNTFIVCLIQWLLEAQGQQLLSLR